MHIRSFIGAALLCLGMMAFAPVAMADPLPDICMLDIAPSAAVTVAPATNTPACFPAILAAQPFAALSPGGDEDEAASPCAAHGLKAIDFASTRLHFDPGRCSA